MKKRKRILIVEDDIYIHQILRDVLEQMVTKFDIEVLSAFNGRQALNKLRVLTVDLIILDLMMPVMSGEQFLKKISENQRIADPKPPVLVLTAMSSISNFVRGCPVMKKPIELNELIETVEMALEGRAYFEASAH